VAMLLTVAINRTLLIVSILLLLIGNFNYYDYYHAALLLAQAQEKASSKDLETNTVDSNIFENFAKQFGNITKQFEYTVDLSGKQIFPNDTLKQDIVTDYKSSTYNISSLKYSLLGFDITASDIKLDVHPSRVDATRTKVDLPLVFARNVIVTNGLLNLKYSEINLGSIYGIYDKISDKMTVHIPINIALHYIPHNL
jgi:hypothetical protein